MSKTLDYGGNANSGNDGKHLRSQQTVTQQPRWFSGLRARISQLNMPEWLTQLGIRNFNYVAPAEMLSDDKDQHKVACRNDQPQQMQDDVSNNLKTPTDSVVDVNRDYTIGSWLWEEVDYEDTLALQHFGPLKNLITGCSHPGTGHDFLSLSVTHPTWCDKCGDFMWGFLTRAVKCDNCNYTCHAKCRSLVTLDCKTADSTLGSCHELSSTSACPNLKVFIENDDVIEEQRDETSGFVQIHMNFMRPINVVAGDSLSFLDVTNESGSLTRISDDSFPLKIVRLWEEKGEKRQLVLQENDTGDILWDMFEIPELENFLKILEDEEKQYSFRIRQKYDAYRWYLDENLRNRGFTVDSDEFSSIKTNSCISTDV
uniref:Phorbol-ester/DAG-type domain-containing protein n=1 Tax=Setaria digitata TaxID=48799 RepID=A0A915PWP4_9BILA